MPVKKILVVDDSPTERQYMIETLQKKGYQIVTADNGEDAIAKAKSELARPDPHGRRDAGAERLPGDARDHAATTRPSTSR